MLHRKFLLVTIIILNNILFGNAPSAARSPEIQALWKTISNLVQEKKFNQADQYMQQLITLDQQSTKFFESLLSGTEEEQKITVALLQFYQQQEQITKEHAPQAIPLLQALVNNNPTTIAERFYLGIYQVKENLFEKSLENFTFLTKYLPHESDILHNIGYILRLLGKQQEAIPYYEQALLHKPKQSNNSLDHFGLAQALLATGNFEQGWKEFEYRLPNTEERIKKLGHHAIPLDNLKNKKILIKSEPWGHGDFIQFIRYAELLKQRGAFVIVQTFKSLMNLFTRCPFIDLLIAVDQQVPPFDYQIPLLSLPLLFKTTVETIPAPIPYLFADPKLVTYWKKQLAHDTNFKIGIFWQTSNSHTEFFPTTQRSIPLTAFAPLANIPGISFYSLQKHRGIEQIKSLPQEFILHMFEGDFDDSHGAFMDTAAVIQNLDLIISADSSMNHLAAALGKQVWVPLPYAADWRWLQNRTDTPWYPGLMRLFRQPAPGDWQSVIMTIKEELLKRLKRG